MIAHRQGDNSINHQAFLFDRCTARKCPLRVMDIRIEARTNVSHPSLQVHRWLACVLPSHASSPTMTDRAPSSGPCSVRARHLSGYSASPDSRSHNIPVIKECHGSQTRHRHTWPVSHGSLDIRGGVSSTREPDTRALATAPVLRPPSLSPPELPRWAIRIRAFCFHPPVLCWAHPPPTLATLPRLVVQVQVEVFVVVDPPRLPSFVPRIRYPRLDTGIEARSIQR